MHPTLNPTASPALHAKAITMTREAIRLHAEAKAAYHEQSADDVWDHLSFDRLMKAEEHLLRAVIAWSGVCLDGVHNVEKRHWPAQGIVAGDVLVLALPLDDGDALAVGQPIACGSDAMRLVVLDRSELVDLDASRR